MITNSFEWDVRVHESKSFVQAAKQKREKHWKWKEKSNE